MNRLEMLVKGKNMRPTNIVQRKLSSAEANLEGKKIELASLQQKRGEESSKNNPNHQRLEYLDDEIVQVKKRIETIPYEIEALEKQVTESEIADAAKKDLYDDFMQAISIKELEAKSRLLLKQLQAALKTNEELQEFHRRRIEVEKKTGRRISSSNICGGFRSLRNIFGICEGENAGSSMLEHRIHLREDLMDGVR